MAEFLMTQQGYDEAVKKLEYLRKDKRAEIVQRIAEARSHGDLSENAEYDAARNEQTSRSRTRASSARAQTTPPCTSARS